MSIRSCRRPIIFLTITAWHFVHSTLIVPLEFLYPTEIAPQFGQCHENGRQSSISCINPSSLYGFVTLLLLKISLPAPCRYKQGSALSSHTPVSVPPGGNAHIPSSRPFPPDRGRDSMRRKSGSVHHRFPLSEHILS